MSAFTKRWLTQTLAAWATAYITIAFVALDPLFWNWTVDLRAVWTVLAIVSAAVSAAMAGVIEMYLHDCG